VVFVRFESDQPDSEGFRAGVFLLANRLARSGRLTPEDWAFWRSSNDWYDAAYADPGSVDPTLWDKEVNPVVECWFKESAVHLLDRVPDYLDLLARYDIRCVERRSTDPGTVLYEDDVQVVVRPHPVETHRG
jgi:hypothetical protein